MLTKSEARPPPLEVELTSVPLDKHGDDVVSVVRGSKRPATKNTSPSEAHPETRIVNQHC